MKNPASRRGFLVQLHSALAILLALLLLARLLPALLLTALLLTALLLLARLLPALLLTTLLLLAGLLIWILIHFTFLPFGSERHLDRSRPMASDNARQLNLFHAGKHLPMLTKTYLEPDATHSVPSSNREEGIDDGTLSASVATRDTNSYSGTDLDIRRLALVSEPARRAGSADCEFRPKPLLSSMANSMATPFARISLNNMLPTRRCRSRRPLLSV